TGPGLFHDVSKFLDADDLFSVDVNDQIVRAKSRTRGWGARKSIFDKGRCTFDDVGYQDNPMIAGGPFAWFVLHDGLILTLHRLFHERSKYLNWHGIVDERIAQRVSQLFPNDADEITLSRGQGAA